MGVKWGVLGTAGIASSCTIPGMIKAEECDLYAIAGRNEAKVLKYKEQFNFKKAYVGYEKLLRDPDVQAVYIPLPNDMHYEWVLKAVKAKKHVLCEKPLALNAKQAEEMFAAAKENNVILMEAYAYLHSPYLDALKKDIKNGLIGDIYYIDTSFVTQGYEDNIRIRKEAGGGAVYDLGCYCSTLLLSLVDSEISYVKADAEFNNNGVDVLTSCIVKFENGVRASFSVGMILGKDTNFRHDNLFIHGANGTIRSSVEFNQEGILNYTIVSADGKITERTVDAPQNYCLEVEQLNRCIMNGEKQYITPEFSVKNAKLLDKVLESIGY